MLPGDLDDAVVGSVLMPLETVTGLDVLDHHWTDSSADGDSPVVVRARVGPADRRDIEVTHTPRPGLDVTPTPGEDARLRLVRQAAPWVALSLATDQEAS